MMLIRGDSKMVKPENVMIGLAGLTVGAILGLAYNHEGMNKLQRQLTKQGEVSRDTEQKLADEKDIYFCMLQMLRAPEYTEGYDTSKKLCSDTCWQVEYSHMEQLPNERKLTPNKMYRKARDACGRRGQ